MTAITEALAASRAVALNEPQQVLMARTYRALRETGQPASAALVAARALAVQGKDKWPKGTRGYGNTQWSGAGEKHMRWIERPSDAGLRFVGYADKLANLDHTGWWTDEYGDGESVRGVVYQLAARDGCPVFVAGYDNAMNGAADKDGPAAVSFDQLFMGDHGGEDDGMRNAKRDAAHAADGIAERMAEEAREYSEAFSAASKHHELGEEIAADRKATLALIAEAKANRASLDGMARVRGMIRDAICEYVRDTAKRRKERAELFRNFGRHAGWEY